MTPTTKSCPFCAEEINAVAIKCMHCGSMLSDKSILIEQTSKKYKKQMAYSGIAAIVGFFLIIFSVEWEGFATLGVLLMLGALVSFLSARMSAWWNHG